MVVEGGSLNRSKKLSSANGKLSARILFVQTASRPSSFNEVQRQSRFFYIYSSEKNVIETSQ